MTESQIKFGHERLNELADTLNLDKTEAAKVALKIGTIKDFYQWVNADQFLDEFLHNTTKERDNK